MIKKRKIKRPKITKEDVKKAKTFLSRIKTEPSGKKYILVKGKKYYINKDLTERQLLLQIIKLLLQKRKRKQVKKEKPATTKPPESSSFGYNPSTAEKFAQYDLLDKIRKEARTPALTDKKEEKKSLPQIEGYVKDGVWNGQIFNQDGTIKPQYIDTNGIIKKEFISICIIELNIIYICKSSLFVN